MQAHCQNFRSISYTLTKQLDGCAHKVRLLNFDYKCLFFTALHAMQTRSSDENSVCPSVRLSVKRVICDKMEERLVQILYHTKDHLA